MGTLKSNRRDIPIEVKNVAERERFSCQCIWETWENKLVLHSYVFTTKSSGQRNVLLLSTVELILGVTTDDGKKKPTICKLCDLTKAGMDVMEHRIGAYVYLQSQIKSLDFLTAFCCILNVYRINATTVFAFNKKIDLCKQDLYDFGMNLAFYLFVRQFNAHLKWSSINVKYSLCFLGKKSKQIHSNKPGLLKEKDYKKKYTQKLC